MRFFTFCNVIILLLAQPLTSKAQDWAKARLETSPRHGEFVTLDAKGTPLKAFVVYPETKDKTTVVVVIHEIFGLTDWVRSVCDQLAEAGYIALAPDMLSGQTYSGIDDARKAIGNLNPGQIRAGLDASVDYAKKIPASNGKVALGGFCWGGAQTFIYAGQRSDIAAFFPFYGNAVAEPAVVAALKAPVYGFFAENDARVNTSLPPAEAEWKKQGKTLELVTYPGAGHGFMRAGEAPDASEANRSARNEAWKRWLKILSNL